MAELISEGEAQTPDQTGGPSKSSISAQAWATRAVFFAVGFAMSCFAPLVPLVKGRLQLDEAQLGLALLFVGIGSVIAMPFSGGWAARFGLKRVIVLAGIVALIGLPSLAIAPNRFWLSAALLLFGAGAGTVDVTMNLQAVVVERESGRAMMSGFHGLFSVGTIFGSGLATAILAMGGTPATAVAAIVTGAVLLVAANAKGLLRTAGGEAAHGFALPRGGIILIGAMCFVLFMTEGSVSDWAGVLLTEDRGVSKDFAGVGYIACATTMTIGRLTGDAIVSRLGRLRVLMFGSAVAAAGLALAALVPVAWVSVVGFGLIGVGASNTVPVLFSAAANQRWMPENLAIAAATTMGYAGLLVGPGLIGFVARASTLPLALVLVAAMLTLVSVNSPRITRSS